jgi:selenocysteine lyase/cysteine desulfurase
VTSNRPGPSGALDTYLSSFAEPVGYLNFGSYGPPSRAVVETIGRLASAASAGVSSAGLHAEDERALAAVSRLTGVDRAGVALAGSTSLGLMQVAFGLPRGEVVVSEAEFPSNLYAWWRSEEAGLTTVRHLPPVPGQPLAPVTPERVADAVGPYTVAVAVSAVDFRTGAVADLAGLREAAGDRLLVVDGIQGFGVVDADWSLADALVVGGQKWLRAGWGTGFVALSTRALDRLRPVLGGWTGVEGPSRYDGVPHAALPGAQRFSVTNGSPFASGALATALEQLEQVGVDVVASRVADTAGDLIARLDAAGVPVLSPVERERRAGIVVAGVPAGDAAAVGARLEAAGVTATVHGDDRVRLSVHATTTPAALDAALTVLGGRA